MADTDILLSVDLNTVDAEKTAEQLQKEIQNIFSSRKGQQSSALTSIEIQMKKLYHQADEIKNKMREIGESSTATEGYSKLSDQLERYKAQLEDLREKTSQFEESGGNTESQKFQQWVIQIEKLEDGINVIESRMQEMRDNGTAFISGRETAEYQALQQELDGVNDRLTQQIIKHREISEQRVPAVTRQVKKLKETTDQVQKTISKISKVLGKFALLFLGVRGLYTLIMKIRSAITEGFKNLRESGVGKLKQQMNDLTNACTTLKNALAGAFEPIVTAIIPHIQKLIEWLTIAIDKLAQFIAAMKGQTTYVKAIKQVGDASEKANRQLSKLDNLNVLTSQKNGATGMFEEAQIADEMIDRVSKLKEKIQEIHDWLDEHIFTPVKDFFKWLISPITDNLDKIKLAFHNLLEVLKPIWDGIKRHMEHIFGIFKEIYEEYIQPSMQKLRDKLSEIIGGFLDFWNRHYEDFKWIAEQLVAIWEESIQPIFDAASRLLGELFATVVDFITAGDTESFFDMLEKKWNWFYPALKKGFELLRTGLKMVSDKIVAFIDYLRSVFAFARFRLEATGSRLEAFRDTCLKVFDDIEEKLKPLTDLFEGLGDSIGRFVGYITGSQFSQALDALDEIEKKGDTISELLGGKDLKFRKNILVDLAGGVGVFGMASGGVIPPTASEHLVMVGDNNHETEVVSPLSTMQEAMINALQAVGLGGGNQEIVLNLDGREFMRAMIKQNNEYKKSHGGLSAMA